MKRVLVLPLQVTIPSLLLVFALVVTLFVTQNNIRLIEIVLFLIGAAFLTWLFFYFLITRRVGMLLAFTRRFASGSLDERTGMKGYDEIGKLGEAFDLMAVKISDDQIRLREREESFRALAENAHDGIILAGGQEGNFFYANNRMAEITGYPMEELMTFRVPDLVAPEYRDWILDMYHRRRAGEDVPNQYELTVIKKDGSRINVEVSAATTRWQGQQAGMVAVRDVTERKKTEEALRQREEQLRHSQKMEAVGRLAGGVAHDFNNFLTAIIGYSELLLARLSVGDPGRGFAEEVLRTSNRAALLTQKLLTFSRKQILENRILDLNGVVTSISSMLQRLIGENIVLRTDLDPRRCSIMADPVHMEQILMNLAINARDAMPQGGVLTIKTAHVDLQGASVFDGHPQGIDGPHIMLSVSDNGYGMDEETMSHLFEPFFTTKEPGKGTGLGLSTVYGIVRQIAGHVAVDSAIGRGTMFNLYFPYPQQGTVEEMEADLPMLELSNEKETVLVVEDEESVRSLIQQILQQKGYAVLTARRGEEALETAARFGGSIHLLVTDVVMPGISGGDLAERMLAVRPETRVLFISGYPDDEIVRHGISHTGTAFLQKPFSHDRLLSKVRESLNARKTP
jgi:PAS domain S-box-containing protein